MSDEAAPPPPTEEERAAARELVGQRLALVSAAIWAVGILGFIVVVFPGGSYRPSSGMFAGLALLALAALPWLAYRPLVERAARRRTRR